MVLVIRVLLPRHHRLTLCSTLPVRTCPGTRRSGSVERPTNWSRPLTGMKSSRWSGQPIRCWFWPAAAIVVVADDGFPGRVVLVRSRGVTIERQESDVRVRVEAGHSWDDVVAQAVAEGLAGIECLAGIPGSTGATPIQNVGAYGQEVAETIVAVDVYDRQTGVVLRFGPAECAFAYRTSRFKHVSRWVVLGGELPTATVHDVRSAALRRAGRAARDRAPGSRRRWPSTGGRAGAAPGQGDGAGPGRSRHLVGRLVLHQPDHRPGRLRRSSRNGLSAVGVAPPGWPEAPDPRTGTAGVKTSAAWLIEQAGFRRGFDGGQPGGRRVEQAHPRVDQPRHGYDLGSVGPRARHPRRCAQGVRRGVTPRAGPGELPARNPRPVPAARPSASCSGWSGRG